MTKRQPHPPTFCAIKPGDQHFVGSMAKHCGQWVAKLTCPECGRQMKMANNYLGGGKLLCTGERFYRPHEQTIACLGHDVIRQLLAKEEVQS